MAKLTDGPGANLAEIGAYSLMVSNSSSGHKQLSAIFNHTLWSTDLWILIRLWTFFT